MYQDKDIGVANPFAYDEDGKVHSIPDDMLPVKLPENINLNVKGNPLDDDKIGNKLKLMEKN